MSDGRRPGIVVVGDLMTDVIALASGPVAAGSDTRARVLVCGGGSAANTAAWLGAGGHPVAYVGRAGDDGFGRAAVAELARAGVDVRVGLDPNLPTGTCVVVVTPDGQRSMFPDAGANAALSEQDLPGELFVQGAHLHLSGYALLTQGSRPAALAALAAARSAGMTISVDPASIGPIAAVGAGRVLDWIAGADLLLANADEAELLAAAAGGPAEPHALDRRFGAVVTKLGAAGARSTRVGSPPQLVSAPQVDVVDTTGAGDCFAAGFLPVWLAGGTPAEALRAGCALAARAVTQLGARPPQAGAGAAR